MKTSLLRILTAIFCLGLFACGSKLTNANFEKINTGMSKIEVEAVLGTPTTVSSQDIPLLATSEYHYKQGNNEVIIIFVNDKVVSKQAQLQN